MQTISAHYLLEAPPTTYGNTALWSHALCSAPAVAAQEFDELKKAYAILTDKSARAALDDCLE
jgi:DnaJ-class molecular chaperone